MVIPQLVNEPWLTASALREKLAKAKIAPGITGETNFPKLIPYLPYSYLPGGKRKLYRLSQVLAALETLQTIIQPPMPTPREAESLHRSRRKKIA